MSIFSFTPECEIFYDGGEAAPSLLQECSKNSGHEKLNTFEDFVSLKDLPEGHTTQSGKEKMRKKFDRTVKLTVAYTSLDRPDKYPNNDADYPYADRRGSDRVTKYGTGYVRRVTPIEGYCYCPVCVKSGMPKQNYWRLDIDTAAHVIVDKTEAVRTTVDLFYNDETKEGVKVAYGVGVRPFGDQSFTDRCILLCVTHDLTCDDVTRLSGDRDL